MVELPVTVCPVCEYIMDSASSLNNQEHAKPAPGDVSLCFRCGAVLQFDNALHVRKAAEADWKELSPKNRDLLLRAQRLILQRKEHPDG